MSGQKTNYDVCLCVFPNVVVKITHPNDNHVQGGVFLSDKRQRVLLRRGFNKSAAHNLKLANDAVSFRARFGGVPFDVWVPAASILGIYARETGQGMIFSHDSGTTESMQETDDAESVRPRPHLRVVK